MIPEIKTMLAGYGLTDAGQRFVIKALHPAASEIDSGGIPDSSEVPSARPEFRNQLIVGPPSNASADGGWDCCMFTLPGDAQHAWIVTAPAGSDFRAIGSNPGGRFTYQVIQSQQVVSGDVSERFTAYRGDTPARVEVELPTLETETRPAAWRFTHRSLTAYLTASQLFNQGTVYVGQFQLPPTTQENLCTTACANNLVGTGELPQSNGRTGFAMIHPLVVPLTEADMVVMNPQVYTAPARDGFYAPERHRGEDFSYCSLRKQGAVVTSWQFTNQADQLIGVGDFLLPVAQMNGPTDSPSEGRVDSNSGPSHVFSVVPVLTGADPEVGFCPWIRGRAYFPALSGDGALDLVARPSANTSFDQRAITVAIWRGLDTRATITLKSICGFEISPRPQSPIRQFVRPCAPYDPAALAAYAAIRGRLPAVLPASANFWGSVLNVLKQIAKAVLPGVIAWGADAATKAITGSGHVEAHTEKARAAPPAPQLKMSKTKPKPIKKKK